MKIVTFQSRAKAEEAQLKVNQLGGLIGILIGEFIYADGVAVNSISEFNYVPGELIMKSDTEPVKFIQYGKSNGTIDKTAITDSWFSVVEFAPNSFGFVSPRKTLNLPSIRIAGFSLDQILDKILPPDIDLPHDIQPTEP